MKRFLLSRLMRMAEPDPLKSKVQAFFKECEAQRKTQMVERQQALDAFMAKHRATIDLKLDQPTPTQYISNTFCVLNDPTVDGRIFDQSDAYTEKKWGITIRYHGQDRIQLYGVSEKVDSPCG